ncbi:MAG: YhcH/YjgK/YiaL family protein [Syntrophaceae bacterium]|nr:YhcH/YjgK/YiaL family protein [Syntrophaceae bacterium]
MIIDHIDNAHHYAALSSGIRAALDYIRTTDFNCIAPGRYELDGDRLFVIVNDYETVGFRDGQLEGHRKYIDVQYMAHGAEWIGYAPLGDQPIHMDYNDEEDCILFSGRGSFIPFKEGMFAVFFPQDLHLPGVGDTPAPVRKIVVKVKL